jgi:spermidine synthase
LSPAAERSGSRRRLAVLLALLGFLVAVQGALLLRARYLERAGTLTPERSAELGVSYLPSARKQLESRYSRILVEEMGTVRTLSFVADDGRQAVESRMDVARPHRLLVPYTQTMFASYLFVPRPRRVLIVGLGGGSMVRFLEHYDPEVEIDAVEIDPAVIAVAHDDFGTLPSPRVRIYARDAFEYLRDTTTTYDVIYMDAFLEPSADTDASGTPLRLKTQAFLGDLQQRVHAGGAIVFNLNELDDLEVIREVFAQTYHFGLGAPGAVAVATSAGERRSPEDLLAAARDLDARFQAGFSFADMVERLRRR